MTAAGKAVCWGSNYSGDSYEGQARPPAGIYRQITAGGVSTCGLRTNSDIICWGVFNVFLPAQRP